MCPLFYQTDKKLNCNLHNRPTNKSRISVHIFGMWLCSDIEYNSWGIRHTELTKSLYKQGKMSDNFHCKVSSIGQDNSYKTSGNSKCKLHSLIDIHKFHSVKGTCSMGMSRHKIHCSYNKVPCIEYSCLTPIHCKCHRQNCMAHKFRFSRNFLDPDNPVCKSLLPKHIRFDTQGIRPKYC